APNKARAECGNYSSPSTHRAEKTPQASHPLPSTPCPCQGPNCSQQPRIPTSPTAPSRIVAPVDWACDLAAHFGLTKSASEFIADQSPFHLIERIDPIFHPPKTNF